MRSVNRVLLAFMLFISIVLIGMWNFIQSERFGKFLSKKITEYTKKNLDSEMLFSRIDLKLFPVGTAFQDLQLKGNGFELVSSNVEVSFSMIDLLSNKLSIQNLLLRNGELFTSLNSDKKTSFKDLRIDEIFNLIKLNTVQNTNIGLKSVSLVNFNYRDADGKVVNFNRLSGEFYNNVIMLNGSIKISGLEKIIDNKNVSHFKHDDLKVELELTDKKIRLKNLQLKSGLDRMKVEGVFSHSSKGKLVAVGKMLFEGGLSKLKILVNEKIEGYCKVEVDFNGPIMNPSYYLKGNIKSLESPWALLDELEVSISSNNENMYLENLHAKKRGGFLKLEERTPLYSFKDKKLSFKQASFEMKKIHTNDGLYFINDILGTLKADLYGRFIFKYADKFLYFYPQKDFLLKNFILGRNENDYILKNQKIDLGGSEIKVSLEGDTYLDANVKFGDSKIRTKGWIKENRIDLISELGTIDLKQLGPISKESLNGRGDIKLDVVGPYEDVRFNFQVALEDFEALSYRFGKIQSNFYISLKDITLNITELKGIKGSGVYNSKGWINFNNLTLNLDFDFPKISYEDISDMCWPLIKNAKMVPFDQAEFNLSSKFKVYGKASVRDIKVRGDARVDSAVLYDEVVDTTSFNFDYINEELQVENLILTKSNSILKGRLIFNSTTKYLEYEANLKDLNLESLSIYQMIGLGFKAKMSIDMYGNGTLSDFSSRTKIELTNSNVDQFPVGNSSLIIYSSGDDIHLESSLLGDQIFLESYLNMSKVSKKESSVKVRVDIDDVKKVLGIIEKRNISDPYLKGAVAGSLDATFDIFEPGKPTVSFILDYLDVKRKNLGFRSINQKNKVIINKGKIEKWDILLKGSEDYILSTGEGNISTNFKISSEYDLHANIFEALSAKYTVPEGKVFGRHLLFGNVSKISSYFEASGSKLSVKLDKVPGIFTDLDFHVVGDGPNIQVNNIQSKYGNGNVIANGYVKLGLTYPEILLKYNVDNTFVKIFKKSGFLVSGSGEIIGNKLPYLATGKVSVLHGKVFDEVSELAKSSPGTNVVMKYVPSRRLRKTLNIIEYDYDVSLLGPVHIKNQLSDIKMIGQIKISGRNFNPVVNGSLNTISGGASKFLFKGHEFLISEGQVDFGDQKEQTSPFLKFSGEARVKEYRVKLNLLGPTEKLAMSLSSTPALSKEDLFSLLTLGVTSDVSKELGDEQRESVTTIGIGTLIFDQLKLNEGLSSSMGLKLSILPEVAKDDTSLLEGKSAVTSSSKVRSATKIKIEKKFNENLDFSVTSTVGGTLDQKQEMNVNYNFNDNFSLDGVLEVKDKDEESSESPQSIGADIKYKWSF